MTRKALFISIAAAVVVVAIGAAAWALVAQSDDASAPAPEQTQTSDTTNAPSAEPSPSAAATEQTSPLTIYYVGVGDGGKSGEKIGCGDSLVATNTGPTTYRSQLKASMNTLLADHDDEYGGSGLRNALADSRLTFVSGKKDGDNVTVRLSGKLAVGGECDGPRVKRQLEQTAATAVGAGQATVYVNGKSLDELLNLRG